MPPVLRAFRLRAPAPASGGEARGCGRVLDHGKVELPMEARSPSVAAARAMNLATRHERGGPPKGSRIIGAGPGRRGESPAAVVQDTLRGGPVERRQGPAPRVPEATVGSTRVP